MCAERRPPDPYGKVNCRQPAARLTFLDGPRKIMAKLDARKSGSFKINGDIEIHRLGFGAMRVTGPRVWGPPTDMAEAILTLERVRESRIDFIDTADSYGPEV